MEKLSVLKDQTIDMDSREIAELTGKRHADVCRDIRRQLEQLEISQSIFAFGYKDKNNQDRTCYRLDYEMTMILVSGYSVPLRAKIIKRWTELEQQNKPSLPSYVETLRLYANEIEKNEQLQLEAMENKPKVEFYESVTGSKDTIDLGQVAKVLNIKGYGRNNLFEFLRYKKILMNNNQPYQKYIDSGYFRLVESKYTKPNGSTHINIKTVVYQKGVDYIRKQINK